MNDNEPDPHVPDPMDQYLAVIPVAPSSAELKEQILAKTIRVIRQRRWSRRLAVAAAMAACYAAGVLTMWSAPRHADVPTTSPIADAPRPLSQPEPSRSTPTLSPVQLEWQAIDQRHGGADLYREAGDRYLNEAQDVESALRCYRNALARGGKEALAISPDDSWLLVALKSAHSTGKNNVYRLAGDRYLNEAQDLASALRCDHNALARGGNEALAMSPGNTWLLMARKSAHSKGNENVKSPN